MANKKPPRDEQERFNWEHFTRWADKNGISLEHPDDWKPSWECWCAAIMSTTD